MRQFLGAEGFKHSGVVGAVTLGAGEGANDGAAAHFVVIAANDGLLAGDVGVGEHAQEQRGGIAQVRRRS